MQCTCPLQTQNRCIMEKEVKIEPKIEETKGSLNLKWYQVCIMLTEKPYVQVLLDKLCQ